MDEVFVGTGLAHGFETPEGGGGTHDFVEVLVELFEGAIGGFAAERVTTYLNK
jgi:hypothetical protein